MPEYRVRWEIDVEADGPSDAACQARLHATKEDTTATVFEVLERDSDGIDGPQFQRIASFDVRGAPSFPHFRALTIEEAEAEDASEDEEGRCTNAGGHEFAHSGTAYGGDDPTYHGEGRSYCLHCGADGDA